MDEVARGELESFRLAGRPPMRRSFRSPASPGARSRRPSSASSRRSPAAAPRAPSSPRRASATPGATPRRRSRRRLHDAIPVRALLIASAALLFTTSAPPPAESRRRRAGKELRRPLAGSNPGAGAQRLGIAVRRVPGLPGADLVLQLPAGRATGRGRLLPQRARNGTLHALEPQGLADEPRLADRRSGSTDRRVSTAHCFESTAAHMPS